MMYILVAIAALFAIAGILRVALPTIRVVQANLLKYQCLRNLQAPRREGHAKSGDDLEPVRKADEWSRRAIREDFVVSGAILAIIGLVAVFLGQARGYGTVAVAIYVSGLVSIVLGVALFLLGSVVRLLARPVLPDRPET